MNTVTTCRCGAPGPNVRFEVVHDLDAQKRADAEHLRTRGIERAACRSWETDWHPGHSVIWKVTGRRKYWCDACGEPLYWPAPDAEMETA